MKKIVSLVLSAVLLVFLAAPPVSATSTVEAVELPLPEYTGELPSVVPMGFSRSFSCNPGGYAEPLATDYYVTQGKTKLVIEGGAWELADCDVSVGFYPAVATNPGPFGVTFSGGVFQRTVITTNNVPSGNYWIYVYNDGYAPVSGTISYSISG